MTRKETRKLKQAAKQQKNEEPSLAMESATTQPRAPQQAQPTLLESLLVDATEQESDGDSMDEDDSPPTIEELVDILETEDLDSDQKAQLEMLILEMQEELEDSDQLPKIVELDSDDEELTNLSEDDQVITKEQMQELIDSGNLDSADEAEVKEYLSSMQNSSNDDGLDDESDVDDDKIQELIDSGDLDPADEAELKEYLERNSSKADQGQREDMDFDQLRELLDDDELGSEDEKELRAYLEMKSENQSGATASKKSRRPEKVFVNHKDTLLERYQEIRLDQPGTKLPWMETMTISSSEPSPFIADPSLASDDLKRELAFYQQALSACHEAKKLCEQGGVPFSRPADFFAEMIKSDAHMQKVRINLVDEAASIKKSEEAKALRQQKKFGKKVQVEKIKERQAFKKAELEKVKVAKKKSHGNNEDDAKDIAAQSIKSGKRSRDDFDVEVDQEDDNNAASKKKARPMEKGGKRVGKDKKFGFGGKKRNSKSNTAESTNDFEGGGKKKGGFNVKKMKAGTRKAPSKPHRPGKAKRQANK